MLDLGIIARRLRPLPIRSKSYRLIEARCTAILQRHITRRYAVIIYCRKTAACAKAFCRYGRRRASNRLTLEAIRVTQSGDRDLFKHLISEATDYVAVIICATPRASGSPLIRVLAFRREQPYTSRKQLAAEQYKHVDMARELGEHNGADTSLADYRAAVPIT